ncbi:Hypothetical predicted protein [Xyrichtys novacula]|uniref:Uncharacterized protein n=1 Tax=Xyrichtys novacula TaxID=13765 RepID=A0AAV1G3U5_XYRNO|nr:Hypothetical predicted protein [Xyrichtys novacula]
MPAVTTTPLLHSRPCGSETPEEPGQRLGPSLTNQLMIRVLLILLEGGTRTRELVLLSRCSSSDPARCNRTSLTQRTELLTDEDTRTLFQTGSESFCCEQNLRTDGRTETSGVMTLKLSTQKRVPVNEEEKKTLVSAA